MVKVSKVKTNKMEMMWNIMEKWELRKKMKPLGVWTTLFKFLTCKQKLKVSVLYCLAYTADDDS